MNFLRKVITSVFSFFFFWVYILFVGKRNAVYNHVEPLPIIMFPCLPPSPSLSRSAVLETFISPSDTVTFFWKNNTCERVRSRLRQVALNYVRNTVLFLYTCIYTYLCIYIYLCIYGFLPRECKRPRHVYVCMCFIYIIAL